MLRLRKKKLLPGQLSDVGAFLFVCFMIPFTFLWEIFYVTPDLYKDEEESWWIHVFIGTFMFVNITGNFLGLWLVDTSTRHIMVPSKKVGENWHFCATCEAVSPPRSWHCNICNTCILKREHHCMFAGYCVGHFNHRFFLLFLGWLWLGVLYCIFFNTMYLLRLDGVFNLYALLKFIFPLIMIMTGVDMSMAQVAIFFWSVHVAAFLLVSVLLVYHLHLIYNGCTTFESNRRIKAYNLGWQQNFIEVLGKRWVLALVWPFGKSKLPHNGVDWDTQESWKLEAPKNR